MQYIRIIYVEIEQKKEKREDAIENVLFLVDILKFSVILIPCSLEWIQEMVILFRFEVSIVLSSAGLFCFFK